MTSRFSPKSVGHITENALLNNYFAAHIHCCSLQLPQCLSLHPTALLAHFASHFLPKLVLCLLLPPCDCADLPCRSELNEYFSCSREHYSDLYWTMNTFHPWMQFHSSEDGRPVWGRCGTEFKNFPSILHHHVFGIRDQWKQCFLWCWTTSSTCTSISDASLPFVMEKGTYHRLFRMVEVIINSLRRTVLTIEYETATSYRHAHHSLDKLLKPNQLLTEFKSPL